MLGCIPPYCSLCNCPALKLKKNSESETEISLICWTGRLTSQRQRSRSDTLPCMAKGRQDSTASFATQERKRLPVKGRWHQKGSLVTRGTVDGTRSPQPFILSTIQRTDISCWSPNNRASILRIRTVLSWRLRDHAGSCWLNSKIRRGMQSGASQVVLVVKNPPTNAQDSKDSSLIPGLERSPGEGKGSPVQYSCLENPMNIWRAAVHSVPQSQTQLKRLSTQARNHVSKVKVKQKLAGRHHPVQSLSHVWVTLCDPMDCSTPGFPVLCHLPALAQTHVHWVSEAIQQSHPLLSSFAPAFNLSQHQGPFQWTDSLHQVVKVLELQLQHQSFQWIFRVDFLQDWLVWSHRGILPKIKSILFKWV